MKQIALKTIEGEHGGKALKISYLEQIKELMSLPMDARSADLNEVRKSLRILDAVEKVDGDYLKLEDADYEHLKQRVLAARWPIISKMVIQFVDDVTK